VTRWRQDRPLGPNVRNASGGRNLVNRNHDVQARCRRLRGSDGPTDGGAGATAAGGIAAPLSYVQNDPGRRRIRILNDDFQARNGIASG
jgi:hypothetical protein